MLNAMPTKAASSVRVAILIIVATVAIGAGTAEPPQGPPRDPRLGPQAAAIGTAAISGAVTMAGTGQPARKVRVNVSGPELRGNRSTATDDQGRFSFTGLPA